MLELTPGQTVYTKVEHVSQSGMLRRISFYVVQDQSIRDITHYVAEKTGYKTQNLKQGLVVRGCGFNACATVVMELAQELFLDPHTLRYEQL